MECKYLSLRIWVKRLARKIICFSKSLQMHKTVVGLCINVKIFKHPPTT
ncbi:MAG: IS1 family transposase [Nitrososphaerota archaeon]|nr:IS1 family transposase [Nitrososphaerota archaeon]